MKKKIIEKCLEMVREKAAHLKKNIDLAVEASQDDTKSSAGDKYETTRAMMQIEIDNHRKRLIETQTLERKLLAIDIHTQPTKIAMGALVFTNRGNFFMSIALGKLQLSNEEAFFVISPDSPIGKQLIGKMKNDSFIFNQQSYQIQEIL
ncbi:MAG: 3-oxoacyl-ACP synthase [Thermonemataceae bacterium]|nr:3-oxoacyl-ACP synthase [Thermonemataceae bacterium]